jgi:hypothetical protein
MDSDFFHRILDEQYSADFLNPELPICSNTPFVRLRKPFHYDYFAMWAAATRVPFWLYKQNILVAVVIVIGDRTIRFHCFLLVDWLLR